MNKNFLLNRLGNTTLVLALVAAGAGALTFHHLQVQNEQAESNMHAVDWAVEATRYHRLLHLANAGKSEELRQALSAKLADELAALRDLPPTANKAVLITAQILTGWIAHGEKTHPEAYLATDPRVRDQEIKFWNSLGESPLLSQTPPQSLSKNN